IELVENFYRVERLEPGGVNRLSIMVPHYLALFQDDDEEAGSVHVFVRPPRRMGRLLTSRQFRLAMFRSQLRLGNELAEFGQQHALMNGVSPEPENRKTAAKTRRGFWQLAGFEMACHVFGSR